MTTVRLAALVAQAKAAGLMPPPREPWKHVGRLFHINVDGDLEDLLLAPIGTQVRDGEDDIWERKRNDPDNPDTDWVVIRYRTGADGLNSPMARSTKEILRGWPPLEVIR